MARPAGEFTKAVHKLLTQSKGKITHVKARPKLAKMGIDVVPEDTDRSSEEWKTECNAFNTAKYQWRLANNLTGSGKKKGKSQRPKSATQSPRSRRRTAKRTGKKVEAAAPEVTMTFEQAIAHVKGNNGTKAVRRRVADLDTEIEELLREQAEHKAALTTIDAADNTIKDAA